MVLSGVIPKHIRHEVGLRGLVSDELSRLGFPIRNVNFPHIVSMASAPSTPTKRGEVDTSRPYADVREAIQRFDHTPGSVKNSAEKRVYESPVVGNLREQLAEAVAAKEKLEQDKALIEKELGELRLKLEHQPEEDGRDMGSLYDELVSSRKKVELLEAQIAASNLETEAAVKKAELAEDSANRVLETVEKAALLHEEDRAASRNEVESLSSELTESRREVSSLTERIAELQAELQSSSEEVSRIRVAESKALASLGEAAGELRALEMKLKQSEDEKNTLQATNRYLEPELESTKAELEALRSENSGSEDSLAKLQARIEAAVASKARSDELVSGLLQAFMQVSAEAIEAQVVQDAVNGEVEKLREEHKALRLSSEASERSIEEAMREVEAAKDGEARALESLRSLSGEEDHQDQEQIEKVEKSASLKIAEADGEAEAIRAREMELKQKLEAARAEIEAGKAQVRQASEKAASAEAAKSSIEGELRRRRSENEQRRKQAQLAGVGVRAPVSGPQNGVLQGDRVADEVVAERKMEEERRLEQQQRHHQQQQQQRGESLAQVLQINVPGKQESLAQKKKKLKLLARLGAVFSPKKKQHSA